MQDPGNFLYKHPVLLFFFTGLLITLGIAGCSDYSSEEETAGQESVSRDSVRHSNLRVVKFLPYWVVTSQFAGYYVGVEKGIYRKYGIDLRILTFDPMQDMEAMVREKKADFAVSWLVNAIKMKDNKLDIVNIAQFSYQSSLMLITKKKSGISKLEDMDGKRAGIWVGYELQPNALFHKYGLNVTLVPIGSTNNLFLQDGVEIINANKFDEYHTILNSGYDEEELNIFYFHEYGFNFLEDGLYCLREMREKDPDLCDDFVTATIESWEYAFNHQAEAVNIVRQTAMRMNYPVNAAHQRWILKSYEELYRLPDSRKINTLLSENDYRHVAEIMLESGQIGAIPPYQNFFLPVSSITSRP